MKTDINVGSITNAQRAQRILKGYGYKADIKKHAKTSASDGCGYAVRVYDNTEKAIMLLEKNGITATEVK